MGRTTWELGLQFLVGQRYSLQHSQTRFSVHTASYAKGSGGKAEHSSLFNAKIKNAWSNASTTRTSSWHNN
jgi:hypothetical protein